MRIHLNNLNIKPSMYLKLFSVLNILGIISCFVDIKLGILASVIILLLVLTHFKCSVFFADKEFVIFIICNVLSVIPYLRNKRPISIYYAAVSFNLIPSLLYYLGKFIGNKGQTGNAIDNLLKAVVFMMLIGMIFYLLFPDIYYNYIGASVESYTYGLAEYRYGSFISSLALGSIGTISIVLYFFRYEHLGLWEKISYLIIIIANIILCMQRSAWIAGFFALIICLIFRFSSNRKMQMRIIGSVILLLIIAIVVLLNIDKILTPKQLGYFKSRLTTINMIDMVSSRSSQWKDAWNVFIDNPVLGLGLGSCGQKAAPYGLEVVTDGNHLRILTEIGAVGFLAFVVMNLKAVVRAIRGHNYYFAIVIFICNITAIGSPIFDQYYSSFAYWLVLGLAAAVVPLKNTESRVSIYEKQ